MINHLILALACFSPETGRWYFSPAVVLFTRVKTIMAIRAELIIFSADPPRGWLGPRIGGSAGTLEITETLMKR